MGAWGPKHPGRAGHQEEKDTQGALFAVEEPTSVSGGEGTSSSGSLGRCNLQPHREKLVIAVLSLSALAVDAPKPRLPL